MKGIYIFCLLFLSFIMKAVSPIDGLLERIDKGASRKFIIEQIKSPVDFLNSIKKTIKLLYEETIMSVLQPV